MGQRLYLATGRQPCSISPLVLPARASPMGKPRFAGLPDHADGSVILNVRVPRCTGTLYEYDHVDWKILQPRPKEQTGAKPTDTAAFPVLVFSFCMLWKQAVLMCGVSVLSQSSRRKPLSGWNPSGSEDPSRPCSARLLSSQTFPQRTESERESTEWRTSA